MSKAEPEDRRWLELVKELAGEYHVDTFNDPEAMRYAEIMLEAAYQAAISADRAAQRYHQKAQWEPPFKGKQLAERLLLIIEVAVDVLQKEAAAKVPA